MRGFNCTEWHIEKKTRGLTASAVDQRVAMAAEEAGQAGVCCVTQKAVRTLSRAPLRAQVRTLSLRH